MLPCQGRVEKIDIAKRVFAFGYNFSVDLRLGVDRVRVRSRDMRKR